VRDHAELEAALRARRDEEAAEIAAIDAARREVEALAASVRARLAVMVRPPLVYDPVHDSIIRSDRMSSAKVKAAAGARAGPGPGGGGESSQPAWVSLIAPLRFKLAERVRPGDTAGDMVQRILYCCAFDEFVSELLDGGESPEARMLAGALVLAWVQSLWAAEAALWETHRVGLVPAATVAMARLADSLGQRFQSALRQWQSYCLRTRGAAPPFPGPAANRLSGYFAQAN
jgi:hypothetical protein